VSYASRLHDGIAAVRLTVAEELKAQFLQASADACRHSVNLIRAVIVAQELRTAIAAFGGSVGSDVVVYTHADPVRAATDAVNAGFLSADDPAVAGIPLG